MQIVSITKARNNLIDLINKKFKIFCEKIGCNS
jgi:hypothetical protein